MNKGYGLVGYCATTDTCVDSGVAYSGTMGNSAGNCSIVITDVLCQNATIFSTNAGAGATALFAMPPGSHSFSEPIVCPKGAGVYTNANHATVIYHLRDFKAQNGAYA